MKLQRPSEDISPVNELVIYSVDDVGRSNIEKVCEKPHSESIVIDLIKHVLHLKENDLNECINQR